MTLCKCGCGGEIIIKPHHKYYGIPEYIFNHHMRGKNHPFYGKHHTLITKKKQSTKMQKTLNPHWKGGIRDLREQIRVLIEYKEWRLMVFGRDNFTCQECNKHGVYLEAHHIKSFVSILRDNNIQSIKDAIQCNVLWNLDNGITLCRECHTKTYTYKR